MSIFSKQFIGLDIFDSNIEIAVLEKRGKKYNVLHTESKELPSKVVEGGVIQDEEALVKILEDLFSSGKTKFSKKNIVFGLPSFAAYTHVFNLNSFQKKNVHFLIREELQNVIPEKPEDIFYTHTFLSSSPSSLEVMLVVIKKQVWNTWKKFFEKYNYEIVDIDIEAFAIPRGLFLEHPKKPLCIVDIGANTSDFFIIDEKGVRFGYSTEIAGVVFTETIAKGLKMTKKKAEEHKKKRGPVGKTGKPLASVQKQFNLLASELEGVLKFFESKSDIPVEKVVLVGKGAKIKGLLEHLEKKSSRIVEFGKAFFEEKSKDLQYIEAIGLAAKGLGEKSFHADLCLSPGKSCDKSSRKINSALPNQKAPLSGRSIFLYILFFLSLILFAFSVYQREKGYEKNIDELQKGAVEFSLEESLDLEIPIVFDAALKKPTNIYPNIYEFATSSPKQLTEASVIEEGLTSFLDYVPEGAFYKEKPYVFEEIESEEGDYSYKVNWFHIENNKVSEAIIRSAKAQKGSTPFYLRSVEPGEIGQRFEGDDEKYFIEGNIVILKN